MSKQALKSLRLRVETLRAELTDPYTVSLGPAAVLCVHESLRRWEAELAKVA